MFRVRKRVRNRVRVRVRNRVRVRIRQIGFRRNGIRQNGAEPFTEP